MKVNSVPSLSGPPYTLAWITKPPDPGVVSELIARGVDALELFWESATVDEDFEWLTALPRVRMLGVDRERLRRSLPDTVLRGLEALTLTARQAKPGLTTAAFRELRTLEVSPKVLEGRLSEIPHLEHLALRTFPVDGFEALSGCTVLRKVAIRGRRSVARLEWTEPPLALEEIQLEGVDPVDLAALRALPQLKRVMISAASRKVPGSSLDLAPLADCPQLEVALFSGFEEYVNADVLRRMPNLLTEGTD